MLPIATRSPTRGQAALLCAMAVMAAFATAGVCAAAMLAPAPAPVVPVLAVFCVLVPMVAAWELPAAISTLRHRAPLSEARAIAGLRRGLAELPEIEHPLGL